MPAAGSPPSQRRCGLTRRPARPLLFRAALLVLTAAIASPSFAAAEITFDDRLAAQEAILRVYHAHLEGNPRPFEAIAPRHVIERKVVDALKLSAALAEIWSRPVTGPMLRAEWERIRRETRLPDRLAEIEAALGHDPVLIQETFVRGVLVERLARRWFAFDERIHAETRREAETLRDQLARGHSPTTAESGIEVVALERTPSGDEVSPAQWRLVPAGEGESPELWRLVSSGAEADRSGPAAATGTERIEGAQEVATGRLPGEQGSTLTGEEAARWRAALPQSPGMPGKLTEEAGRFTVGVLLSEEEDRIEAAFHHVPKRTWDDWWRESRDRFEENPAALAAVSAEPGPEGPGGTPDSAGGGVQSGASGSCLPDDVWTPYLTTVPIAGEPKVTVWTGSLMIVFGIAIPSLYDPLTDSWSPLPTSANRPSGSGTSGVWTGTEMIVWGSSAASGPENTGGRFDPAAGSWTATSQVGAPSGRYRHTTVWTGSRMIVWGGYDDISPLGTGGIYDPATDSWTPVTTVNAPSPRVFHTAVWTGSRMIVWGGWDGSSHLDTGGAYDPATDTWTPVTTTSAPTPRIRHTAIWTGTRMIVWGGENLSANLTFGDGGLYDPATDSWSPLSTTGSVAVHSAAASWTGTEMIVWGGEDAGGLATDAGGRYDPVADSWSAMTTTNAPPAAFRSGIVWTGTEVIVWGGDDGTADVGTGGRYDPATDTWVPSLSLSAVFPDWLWDSAVWTGSEMIVWGGSSSPTAYGVLTDTGARYDPLTSLWTPTATAGAPEPRVGHSAVWTGDSMIVWGGGLKIDGGGFPKDSGGVYDPVADAWTPTSVVGAPQQRLVHFAFWTGDRMLIWGGTGDMYCNDFDTGGLYDPVTDTWTATSTAGAAEPRIRVPWGGTAVWTGSEMIVWGGVFWQNCYQYWGGGARYDPAADAWTPMADAPVPHQEAHSAVWTGTEMIIWGGSESTPSWPPDTDEGARYNPVLDAWFPTSTLNAAEARERHSAVWTGEEMIVWGGIRCILTSPTSCQYSYRSGGGRYDPSRNTWTPMTTVDEARPRSDHYAIWTGQEMIVKGGYALHDGRYALGGGTDNDGDGFSECAGDCYDGDPDVYPGAPFEICDGEDTDCDAVIPPGEADGDSDGVRICAGDCDDTDAGAWAPPSPVTIAAVEELPGGTRIHWNAQDLASGPGTAYDVFAGPGHELRPTGGDFSGGTCAAADVPDAFWDDTDPDPPPVDGVVYFMIRARNSCGIGTWGDANRDATVPLSASPCP